VVLRDIEPHPILKMSIRESDVIISKTQVNPGSSLADCTLGSIRLASETGMWVIAIRRGKEWLFGPDENTDIKVEDILIARGPEEGEKSLLRLARGKGKFRNKLKR
ncbi:MAG: PhoU family transcriptional regulator, partial [Thermoplasmata archaeon]|nr:PhoU family transcriptional regulator [Thermoplasmata archaeon]